MNVTQLIEDLQEIADLDPTTEIVILVPLRVSDDTRAVANVEFLDESTLEKPIAGIFTKQRAPL